MEIKVNGRKHRTKPKVIKFRVPIVIEPDTIGFHVYSPALKGLHVDGDTEEEALRIGKEAARLHLQSMIENGDPIPIDVIEHERAHVTRGDNKGFYVEEIELGL